MSWPAATMLLLATLSLGCGDALPSPAKSYPAGPYRIAMGATVPDLAFEGIDAAGTVGTVKLADFYTPEAKGLLVITVTGGLWCGSCRWPRLNPDALVPAELRESVTRLDLVLGDRDNAAADANAAIAWQHAYVDPSGVVVGADPQYRLRAALAGEPAALPLMVIVDTHTMEMVDWLANPHPIDLRRRLRDLSGSPISEPSPTLVDDLFLAHEWALLQQTTLPTSPPASASNEAADSPLAAALGHRLFFDAGLSPSGAVSCASCHQPEHGLSDASPQAVGVAAGARRTPRIALASHGRWQFWDGRADSLWSQALAPFENPLEFDSSRTLVARRVLSKHLAAFTSAFPNTPLPDTSAWPAQGKPGDAAYDALPPQQQDNITGVFVLAGKAIAAWERGLRVKSTPLDAYLSGDFEALDFMEKFGLQLFVRNGCTQCHWGPLLSDGAFHNVGFPAARRDGRPDVGRREGLMALMQSEFAREGKWSAAPGPGDKAAAQATDCAVGQFKTPTLRGVASGAFFGHAGQFPNLEEVNAHYGWTAPAATMSATAREPWLVPFGETIQWGLLPFLNVLTDTTEVQPPAF